MHLVKQPEGWSKSALASEFGIDRRTVAKLIAAIEPIGTVGGHPVYRIKDVAFTLGQFVSGGVGDPNSLDPEELPPKERLDWYNGEKTRIAIEKESRRLIDIDEMGDTLAMVFDAQKTFVVTLPDVLERDVGLSPDAIQHCIEVGDKLLADFAEKLLKGAPHHAE